MIETFAPASSHIETATYDSEERDLTVTFKDGSEYVYHNVPQTVFLGMQNARSCGEYHARQIRGVYSYEQM